MRINKKFDNNLNITQNLEISKNITIAKINVLLKQNSNNKESKILEAMRYMLLSKGKMIRPFLVYAINIIFSQELVKVVDLAVAIEMIHTYTLIHDDLPAMDNDDLRRDQLSCHKKFNEATAILTGNGLLTLAFEILSRSTSNVDAETKLNVINEISKLIGFNGVLLGQILDLSINGKILGSQQIEKIKILKTSSLFIASCKCSAIINNASYKEIYAITLFAKGFGLIYQMKDDIDDHESIKNKESLKHLLAESLQYLKPFGNKASMLYTFTKHLFDRYI